MKTYGIGYAIVAATAVACATAAAAQAEVTTCGTVITVSGEYMLANDLLGCAGTAITINASGVELRLEQHTIRGVGVGSGIYVSPGQTNVKIQGGGLIKGFQVGILFENVDDSRVTNVRASGNHFGIAVNFGPGNAFSENNRFLRNRLKENAAHGITVNGGSNNYFFDNESNDNGGRGIYLFRGTGNEVEANTTNGNAEIGISVEGPLSTDHFIHGNTALGNGADLADGNPACDNDKWTDNHFVSAFPASCIGPAQAPTLPRWSLPGAVLVVSLCGLVALKRRTIASHSVT